MKSIRVTVFNCHFLNRERYSTSGSKTSSRNRTFKRKDNLLIVKAKNEKGKWDFKVYTAGSNPTEIKKRWLSQALENQIMRKLGLW